jgi:hypothetical protein
MIGGTAQASSKSGKRREVPMSRTVYDVPSALAATARTGGAEPDGLVFRHRAGPPRRARGTPAQGGRDPILRVGPL